MECNWTVTQGQRCEIIPLNILRVPSANVEATGSESLEAFIETCREACVAHSNCSAIQHSMTGCQLLGGSVEELQARRVEDRDWSVEIKYCKDSMPDSASLPLIIGIAILALIIIGLTLTAIKLYLARRKKTASSESKVRETTVNTVDIGTVEHGLHKPGTPAQLTPAMLRDSPKKGTPAGIRPPTLLPRDETDDSKDKPQESFDDSSTYSIYANPIKQNYEVDRKKIQLKEKLGKGHFGTVYAAQAEDLPYAEDKSSTKVAVKTMHTTSAFTRKEVKDEFTYELEVMKIINIKKHPNVIRLLGQVTASDPKMLVLEYMENGNLQHYLRQTKTNKNIYSNLHGNSSTLTSQNLLQFALDIAKGMECVGELQLVHRDLAARNILIGKDMTCKVADFGYAKDLVGEPVYTSHNKTVTRPRPIRWLPLESLIKFKHSIQSDVWSFGITMWEIITLGNLPYPRMSTKDVVEKLKNCYRMGKPDHCSEEFYSMMMKCWHVDPQKRPTFTTLVKELSKLMKRDHVFVDNMGESDYVEDLPPIHDEKEFLNTPM